MNAVSTYLSHSAVTVVTELIQSLWNNAHVTLAIQIGAIVFECVKVLCYALDKLAESRIRFGAGSERKRIEQTC